jgi:hypothetical protein
LLLANRVLLCLTLTIYRPDLPTLPAKCNTSRIAS